MRRLLLLFVSVTARRHRHGDISSVDTPRAPEIKGAVPFGEQYRNEQHGMKLGHNDPIEDLSNPPVPRSDKKYFSKHHKPGLFTNPRDAYLLKSKQAANVSEDAPLIFDFAKILEENIWRRNVKNDEKQVERFRNPVRPAMKPKSKPKPEEGRNRWLDDLNDHGMNQYFRTKTFNVVEDLNRDGIQISNWTTCEEFAIDSSFHPDDIVNLEWIPFFVWSEQGMFAVIHKFEVPTIKLVETYRDTYGPYLNVSVNWNEPKLLMRSPKEILLIALDRTGLFFAIPKHDIPEGVKGSSIIIPTMKIRLKIVDPYLAMMYCNVTKPYAAIMAIVNQEPLTVEEKTEEAKILNFRGPSGLPAVRNLQYEAMIKITKKSGKETEDNKYIDAIDGLFSKNDYDEVQKELQEHDIQEVRFYL